MTSDAFDGMMIIAGTHDDGFKAMWRIVPESLRAGFEAVLFAQADARDTDPQIFGTYDDLSWAYSVKGVAPERTMRLTVRKPNGTMTLKEARAFEARHIGRKQEFLTVTPLLRSTESDAVRGIVEANLGARPWYTNL